MDTEQVQVEDRALRYIAKVADGSMRDAFEPVGSVYCLPSGQRTDLRYDPGCAGGSGYGSVQQVAALRYGPECVRLH